MANREQAFRQEREKMQNEKDELVKNNAKLLGKENSYKHEIKQREQQIEKLKDVVNKKLTDNRPGKTAASASSINGTAGTMDRRDQGAEPNMEIKYQLAPQGDFSLMITQNCQEIQKRLADENGQLRDCLKHLQRELFEIVDLKTDIYRKRLQAEFPQSSAEIETEVQIRHDIERIREELFNLPYE